MAESRGLVSARGRSTRISSIEEWLRQGLTSLWHVQGLGLTAHLARSSRGLDGPGDRPMDQSYRVMNSIYI
jgi:hypothetical protein